MHIKRWILFFIILLIPLFVLAESTEEKVKVAEGVKYYRTDTILSNSAVMRAANLGEVSSLTTEITEEEYNNVDTTSSNSIEPRGLISYETETTYKKLTTTMYQRGTYYFVYQATLDWKKIPSTRSYDIIAIGFLATVEVDGIVNLTQTYCRSATDCNNSNGYWQDSYLNGAAAVFHLPSGTLTSLRQVIDFDVVKYDSSDTITYQVAAGDYSHATSSISYDNAKKFYVDCGGIRLNSSVESYYDEIDTADAIWRGTW